jgi:GlpG protein
MRQITTLPDEEQARRFSDYLLTLQIKTQIDEEQEGWALWVCDEDKVPQARQELERFTQNPDDPRYNGVTRIATQLRREEARTEDQYFRRMRDLAARMRNTTAPPRWLPVTIACVAISVVVSAATGLGHNSNSPVFQALSIAPFQAEAGHIYWAGLDDILRGQVWRLVTPMFLHFGVLHLLFNVVMFYRLGMFIEWRRGSWRILGLVLLSAVLSNLAEYYLDWGLPRAPLPVYDPSPLFGGLSGVLYGLFGYLWMRSKYNPEQGMHIDSTSVLILLGWLLLCLTGLIGGIANVAHAVGLIVGVAVGIAPHTWRSLRGQ